MTLSLAQIQDKKTNCRGCRDDFYNHGNRSTCGHCWGLADAKKVWRWAINMQSSMGDIDNFKRVNVYNCFHGEGPHRDIYIQRLPAHLGGRWADKREQVAADFAKAMSDAEKQELT